MIEVKNLTKKYKKLVAVSDLSFTVKKGEVCGFLGENGAGKSTTMNIITGYIAPTSGEVLLGDVDIIKNPEKAKENIGYLPEIPPLYNSMTVYEYLYFVTELKKVDKVQRFDEVERVAKLTNILDVEQKLISTLSKGYRQRVGMAQALIGNPEILIFDEPTAGLDPKQTIEVRNLIKKLGKDHAILISSHILSEISEMCDQIIIISKGKLIASGDPEKIKGVAADKSEIIVTIIGDEKKAIVALEKIRGVKSVEANSKDADGNSILSILVESKDDLREKISRELSKRQIVIVGMTRKEKSLEELFMEVTEEV